MTNKLFLFNYKLSLNQTFLLLFSVLSFCFNANATIYFVNNNATTGDVYCTAVGNNANNGLSAATPKLSLTNLLSTYSGVLTSGDVIKIDAGIYSDANITLNIAGISIVGAGPAKTVFDNASASADANRLFTITANNITISGLYVKGYNRGTGGASAIQISGVTGVVFNNVLSDENRPGGGSATIVIDGGSSVVFNGGGSNCNSTGSVAGGGVNVEGNGNNVTFNNYSFSNNSKDFQGGSGLYVVGNNTTNVTLNNCILADNRNTSADGGAIFISGSNLTVSGTCFSNNSNTLGGSGPKYGGAVTVGRGATASFTNCTFTNNSVTNSGKGGAISINTSLAGSGTTATVTVTTCSFTGNTASSSPGGNHLYARVGSSNSAIFNINNCTFSASGQDIMNGNTATINLQNSGNPSKSGTVNTINTTAPSSTAVTNCPVLQGSCYGVILPIELIDFTGFCQETYSRLEWATATERNNDYFTIEHAGSNGQFSFLTQIIGQINASSNTYYSFNDYYSEPGYNYYRLSQTDIDGAITVLKTISINNTCLETDEATISCSFNIASHMLNLGYLINQNEVLKADVYNSMGQLVQSTEIYLKSSERKSEIELSNFLSSGVYFLKLSNDTLMVSDKFIVSK